MITPWTESPTFGVTRNPWDRSARPAGRPAASAAAWRPGSRARRWPPTAPARSASPPAAAALFGMKAQNGRVPTAPQAEPWHGMSTWGPVSRPVADSALFYDAIKDGGPRFADALPRPPGRAADRRARSARRRSPACSPTTSSAARCRRSSPRCAISATRSSSASSTYRPTLMAEVLSRYLRGIADAGRRAAAPRAAVAPLARLPADRRRDPAARSSRERARRPRGRRALALWPDGFDLVLTPMFTRRAAAGRRATRGCRRAVSLSGSIRFVPYCGPYNHTGQPAASVPAGLHARRASRSRCSSSRRATASRRCWRWRRSSRRRSDGPTGGRAPL